MNTVYFITFNASTCMTACSDAGGIPIYGRTSGGSTVQCTLVTLVVTHAMGLNAKWAAGVVSEGHPDALTHFSLDNRS